jgi:hypothetical protein
MIHQEAGPRRLLHGLLERLEDEAAYDIGLRSAMRRSVYTPITLGVIAGDYKPLYRGWATDLSLNGLGMLTEHDVPMNASLTISLEALVNEPLLLPVRICYVSQLMSQTYRIGGVFDFQKNAEPGALLF